MPVMVTLHGYVLRELLKTFGLTLAALTVLITMGGGLYNVIRFEGISAVDVVRFVPLLAPIATTIAMPIAALFAATMTYGRLAADNELTACRAAGVNVHRLLGSAALLAVFVAAFTFLMSSFVLPGYAQQLERMARSNVRDFVAQQLRGKGFIHRGKSRGGGGVTLTAEDLEIVGDAQLRERGFETGPGLHYLLIHGPTFLQTDEQGQLERFAAARLGLCVIDTRKTPMEGTLYVRDGRDYVIGRHAVVIKQQQIGPLAISLPFTQRLSVAFLADLIRWRTVPWEAPRLADDVRAFRIELTRQLFGATLTRALTAGETVRLTDEAGHEYELRARSAGPTRKGVELAEAEVLVRRSSGERLRRYAARQVEVNLTPLPNGELLGEIRLVRTGAQDVLEYAFHGGREGEPRRQPTISLDGIVVPAEVRERAAAFTPAAVFDPDVPLPAGVELGDQRIGLQKAGAQMIRRLTGAIHFRVGICASALATVVMGAALGIVFRGARALAAFALALVPLFCVTALLVLGRQLTEGEWTSPAGPVVTWGGLGAALVANALMVGLGVRR